MAHASSPRRRRERRCRFARRLPLLAAVAAVSCAPPSRPEPAATSISTLSVVNPDGSAPESIDLRHQPDVGQSTVSAPFTAVWTVLPGVFERLEIPVLEVDASAGLMGNQGYRARRVEGQRMSRWLDCGRGPVRANADVYEVTLSVVVQVLAAPDDATTVRTTVDAYARDRSLSGSSIHCISWGALERRVAELAAELLDG